MAALVLLTASPAAAIPVAPGYTVTTIATDERAVGDVIVVGGVVFVGQGDSGAGTQSVVRIDGGTTTVLAEGFNALGGFVYDAVNDRLIVSDNGGNIPGAVTGDTVYGIDSPFAVAPTVVTAASVELLASGSVPGAADVALDPTDPTRNTLFISDTSEAFPPTGLLLEADLSLSTASVIQSGLAFSAGLATDSDTLYFGQALLDFSGEVSTVPLSSPGDPLAVLATGLPGQFDLELGTGDTVLATAGGELVAISTITGDFTTLATGFGFATTFGVDGEVLYALDGFPAGGDENLIWVFTPVPEPGTALLMGFGTAIMAWRGRNRRNAA